MSSTETLPTERRAATPAVTPDALRAALAMAVLALIWISLRPFDAGQPFDGSAAGFAQRGLLMNQLGYSAMAVLVLATLVSLTDRRILRRFVSAGWLLMAGIVIASAFTDGSHNEWRAVTFSLIGTALAATMTLLPASARDFETVLKTVSLALLGLCYAGLVLDPDAAIHQARELEAQHAGLWRGVFFHKNIAGPVMVMVGFGGIFLIRRGHFWGGGAVAALAFLFALNAGSKTALALAPIVVAIVLLPALAGLRPLAAIAAVGAVAGAHAFTIGTVFVPGLDAVLRAFHETTTFTGRTVIWDFARDYMLARPWTGYGFEGFWGTSVLRGAEQPFDSAWDPRGIVHGHNGFLDTLLFFGLPGLFVMIWLVVLAPAVDYVRAGRRAGNGPLADFFFMVIVFAVLTSALESFYFRRADPIWLTMVMALAGLRLCARMPLRG